jgi:hypothetical protein
VIIWGKLAPGACLCGFSFFRDYGSDNKIPPGNRRVISTQEFEYPSTGRLADPTEVGGLHQVVSKNRLVIFVAKRKERIYFDTHHQVVSELIFAYRIQAKEKKRGKSRFVCRQ